MAPGTKNQFALDLNDEVVRGSLVLQKGELIWPPPKPPSPPPGTAKAEPAAAKKEKEAPKVVDTWTETVKDTSVVGGALASALALGLASPEAFNQSLTTFALATIVGYQVTRETPNNNNKRTHSQLHP